METYSWENLFFCPWRLFSVKSNAGIAKQVSHGSDNFEFKCLFIYIRI